MFRISFLGDGETSTDHRTQLVVATRIRKCEADLFLRMQTLCGTYCRRNVGVARDEDNSVGLIEDEEFDQLRSHSYVAFLLFVPFDRRRATRAFDFLFLEPAEFHDDAGVAETLYIGKMASCYVWFCGFKVLRER